MEIGFGEFAIIAACIVVFIGKDRLPFIPKAFKNAYIEFQRTLNESAKNADEDRKNSDERS